MVGADWALVTTMLTLSLHPAPGEQCELPAGWTGEWFLSGQQDRLTVTQHSLGWLGRCHARLGHNKFVLHRAADQCYQCVAIWVRHTNALEFKSGECADTAESPDSLCDISPDTTLNTLVRLGGLPVDCPLEAPATFTYNKGTGECASPLSELGQCLGRSQVKLRYHACPDITQTESKGRLAMPAANIYEILYVIPGHFTFTNSL